MASKTIIRKAKPADAQHIVGLIQELAEYEKLGHEMQADAASLAQDLAAQPAPCQAWLACEVHDGQEKPVGYALTFQSYSTFRTRQCLFLEDLYVTPAARGHGHGKDLLATVAAAAVAMGCPRLEWHVLAWNDLAIGFYRSLGAGVFDDWQLCRLHGKALEELATQGQVR